MEFAYTRLVLSFFARHGALILRACQRANGVARRTIAKRVRIPYAIHIVAAVHLGGGRLWLFCNKPRDWWSRTATKYIQRLRVWKSIRTLWIILDEPDDCCKRCNSSIHLAKKTFTIRGNERQAKGVKLRQMDERWRSKDTSSLKLLLLK